MKVSLTWQISAIAMSFAMQASAFFEVNDTELVVTGLRDSELVASHINPHSSLYFPVGLNSKEDRLRWGSKKVVGSNALAIYRTNQESTVSVDWIFNQLVATLEAKNLDESIRCSGLIAGCGFYLPRELAREESRKNIYKSMEEFWNLYQGDYRFFSGAFEVNDQIVHIAITVENVNSDDTVFYALDIVSDSSLSLSFFDESPGRPLEDAARIEELVRTGNVSFKFDSLDYKGESEMLLLELSKYLMKNKNTSLRIIGHADDFGPEEYNERLSLRRAQKVKSELVKNYGVSPGQLLTLGRGSSYPNVSASSPEARAANRRVEFEFVN